MERAPYSLLVVALLAYGYIVGCADGTHREIRIVESEEVQLRTTWNDDGSHHTARTVVSKHFFICSCGRRIPYSEVWL